MAGLIFIISWYLLGIIILLFACSIKVIRPTHRGVIERFGKYMGIRQPGLHIVKPIMETLKQRNITERIADVEPQDIITKDNLNARVDLQIYFKVKNDEQSIKNSYYNINDFKAQIIALAQSTARNVIGDMKFAEVNNQRNELNAQLARIMESEIKSWGIEIVRVELKEITPPKDVQETMNKVIKAQNEKDAAIDLATAAETLADGKRRASIKEADGIKQAKILEAQGQAEAIRLVNESAEKYFTANAEKLKRLETMENSLKNNSKIILTQEGITPQLLIGSIPISNISK